MYLLKILAHKLWKFLRIPTKLQLFLMKRSQDSFLIGVTGIILNHKNEIMFLKHTYREIEWSLPGGYVKAKEHPKEALVREIKEESNLDVRINKRLAIWADKHNARIDIPYIGTHIGGKFRASPEVSEVKFFSPLKLPPILEDQKKLILEVVKSERLLLKKSNKELIVGIFKRRFGIGRLIK